MGKKVAVNRKQCGYIVDLLQQDGTGRIGIKDLKLIDKYVGYFSDQMKPPAAVQTDVAAGAEGQSVESKPVVMSAEDRKNFFDETLELELEDACYGLVKQKLLNFSNYNPADGVRQEILKIAEIFGI